MAERLMVTTAKLGVGQILAWGSAFYLPAILASAMGESLACRHRWCLARFRAHCWCLR